MTARCPMLHVFYSLRAEGVPRLVLEMLREEKRQTGQVSQVALHTRQVRDLEPHFRELGVTIHDLPWRRRRYDVLFASTVKLLRQVRPRGVLCYSLGLHVPVVAAAWALGIPCVVHVGTAPPVDQPRVLRKLRWQMLAGLPFTRLYVGCSQYVREAIERQYSIPHRKTAAIYNGIRLEPFTAVRPRRTPAAGVLRIGMVASLEPSKDHETLLKAVKVLKQRGQPARLRLVGDGTWRGRLEQRTRELGIDDYTEFRGTVIDIPGELADLDVFAYSARPEEGMGIALVEALAAGLPCVGSDVAACREVLQGGQLGTIVSQQDPQLWADALLAARGRASVDVTELEVFKIATTYQEYCRALFEPWPPFSSLRRA